LGNPVSVISLNALTFLGRQNAPVRSIWTDARNVMFHDGLGCEQQMQEKQLGLRLISASPNIGMFTLYISSCSTDGAIWAGPKNRIGRYHYNRPGLRHCWVARYLPQTCYSVSFESESLTDRVTGPVPGRGGAAPRPAAAGATQGRPGAAHWQPGRLLPSWPGLEP
jgi:hypothetical protein